MSRFYGSLSGDQAKTDATRCGRNNLTAHVRGWDIGVRVICTEDENGKDVINVYKTKGSRNPSGLELVATVQEEITEQADKG